MCIDTRREPHVLAFTAQRIGWAVEPKLFHRQVPRRDLRLHSKAIERMCFITKYIASSTTGWVEHFFGVVFY